MWIDEYLKYVDGTEPPFLYHKWTAISCIAGAIGKRVFTRIGPARLWPNLYITLVGPSGARKSTAMGYGESILRAAHIITAPDSLSGWQAFIKVMEDRGQGLVMPELGGTIMHHSLTVFAKELKVFLKSDIDFLAALTDLHDCEEKWEYFTIKRELQTLSWACLNMLGATAPDWIRTMLPIESVGGGYTARNIYVWAPRKGSTNPFPEERAKEKAALVKTLRELVILKGESLMTKEAAKIYGEWYLHQDAEIDAGRPPINSPRFEAYCSRRAPFIRKLMMISAFARGRVECAVEDFNWALASLEEVEPGMLNVFAGLGVSPLADLTYRVARIILEAGKITSGELLRRMLYDLDPISLRAIEDNLAQQEIITVMVSADGKNRVYTSSKGKED